MKIVPNSQLIAAQVYGGRPASAEAASDTAAARARAGFDQVREPQDPTTRAPRPIVRKPQSEEAEQADTAGANRKAPGPKATRLEEIPTRERVSAPAGPPLRPGSIVNVVI